MKHRVLTDYTKDPLLIGQNSMEILQKFIQYANLCRDSINIYTYMEEKSICVYLAHYWINKFQFCLNVGDFKDCLTCLKQAQSRQQIINQDQIDFSIYKKQLYQKLFYSMKSHHLKSKRSVQQYQLLIDVPTNNNFYQQEEYENKIQKLIEIYEKKYIELRNSIQRKFLNSEANLQKPYSWMNAIYKQSQDKFRKIQEKIKVLSHNNFQASQAMKTPLKTRDLMRLTKTQDSVQLLKKKKRQSQTKSKKQQKNKLNDDDDEQYNSSFPCISLPVGKRFSNLKRRVTFSMEDMQLQKLRGEQTSKSQYSILRKSSLARRLASSRQASLECSKAKSPKKTQQ